ncbi:MAG: Uma2 family endonuclease [Myxococcales bacterium]|nr:Uma2 family endonuclease [Myxococcales bacterium]
MSTSAPTTPMSFDAFLAWAEGRSERYELVEGTPVLMAPERAGHARMKARVHRALAEAIESAGADCEAFVDGMTVQVDDQNAYEPDVVVQCGPRLPDDAVVVEAPLIVVEVLSRSTQGRDAGAKLDDYFRIPSVMHYLMVKTDRFGVIHHARRADGTILTRILGEGLLHLDPPGLSLDIGALSAQHSDAAGVDPG